MMLGNKRFFFYRQASHLLVSHLLASHQQVSLWQIFYRQTSLWQVFRWRHSFRKTCLLAFLLSASHIVCAHSLPCRLASEPIGLSENVEERTDPFGKQGDVQNQILQSETVSQDEVPQKEKKEVAAEQLSKALDYFTSQKYHECLMIMQELDKHYRLNPRYKAYLGVCYYYEWDYKQAAKYLSAAIPQLGNFSPHERSFYYWANAESLFNLQKYAEAIPFYQAMLPLCYANEKPDVHYRLGFCYLFAEQWNEAWNELLQAQKGYLKLRNTPDMQARITQVSHMLDGLKPKVVSFVLEELIKK